MEEQDHSSVPAISRGRLEILYDGIFAIAMTILVLELRVPELVDRHSVAELASALAHNGYTFGSYLLSFLMLGMFWYRHNLQYRHVRVVTAGMLALYLVQLAAAAFFPFCAALFGRYPTNGLSVVVYAGCVMVYFWASLATWVIARRSGALVSDLTAADYRRSRNRLLRACVIISILFAAYFTRMLVR
ncbi:MAG: TMEM175 family protein [Candidatus Krumholzibacteriaceae bacterium]|jgi:uncharacterized membrane protein